MILNERKIKRSLNGIFILLLSFLNSSLSGGELLTRIEKELSFLIDIAKPSVVSITSTVAYKINSPEETSSFPFWGKKSPKSQTVKFRNVSSGLVLNQNGYIVTKSSVVKDAEDIQVTLYNQKEYKARFIGFDYETGLAVIKIDDVQLTPAKLGNSSEVKIGKWVAIMGNSVGVTSSVSLGIINGIREENALIQLSALISPGNSGSPIFNTDGEVIGMVAARINSGSMTLGGPTAFQSFEGGVAYPVNVIQTVAENIIKNKNEKRPWLGISTQDIVNDEGTVLITRVVENSPAFHAGLKLNDIVIGISDQKVQTSFDLVNFLKNAKPGSTLVFTVKRGQEIVKIEVVPDEWPANKPFTNINPGIDYFLNSVTFDGNGYMQKDGKSESDEVEMLRMRVLKLEEEILSLKKQMRN